jgi:hypothetical protein
LFDADVQMRAAEIAMFHLLMSHEGTKARRRKKVRR